LSDLFTLLCYSSGEAGEKIQYHTGQAAEAAKDTLTAAGVKASEATEATKDTLLTVCMSKREILVSKAFDSLMIYLVQWEEDHPSDLSIFLFESLIIYCSGGDHREVFP
jgi:hypothetical protein